MPAPTPDHSPPTPDPSQAGISPRWLIAALGLGIAGTAIFLAGQLTSIPGSGTAAILLGIAAFALLLVARALGAADGGISPDPLTFEDLEIAHRSRREPRTPAEQESRKMAHLLVAELVLYNQEAIAVGLERGDLYARIGKDIERSRQMYLEREGSQEVDFFLLQLIDRIGGGSLESFGLDRPG